ncbi:hypothetical protein [Calothrix sp. FACHB-1219]|uniref:hypothetical protein n=2 Tax=Calothrix TaxID=1186 RepID=UPI0030D89F8B
MAYSSSSSMNKSTKKKGKKTTTQPQTCSSCGDIECFERPRFFGGQLLTDKDLEAAQRYVIEKNKLHNRYLVGTGVVCGLAVRCDPCCDGSVIVESGYAIDCCGNDIVLCQSEKVNVFDCLEKQREEEEPYCGTKIRSSKSQQVDQTKEYYLVLFYDEELSNPVTALIRDNGCGNSRCQPSRIRESFRFELVEKKADIKRDNLIPDDSFLGQVRECITKFLRVGNTLNAAAESEKEFSNNPNALDTAFYQLRSYVLEFYNREPETKCNLPDKVAEIENKYKTADTPQQKYNAAVLMLVLLLQLLIDCFCNAILVPCAECDEEEGVILACLTIQGHKIDKICNIVRRQLITGPSLRYWMEPLFSAVERLLELGCCDLDLLKRLERTLSRPQG